MVRCIRSLAAGLAMAALLAFHAAPASAGSLEEIDQHGVPPMFDLVVMRPLGLVATVGGAAAFVPVAAMTAMFRPQDIDVPFDVLVKGPFTFTFLDPIGVHGEDDAY